MNFYKNLKKMKKTFFYTKIGLDFLRASSYEGNSVRSVTLVELLILIAVL